MHTPPVACVVPDGVFDAFAWCSSDVLEWRRPSDRWDAITPVDGSAAERMVFVLRGRDASSDGANARDFLPCELARLHATGLGLDGEEALAPWGIDAATDGLYAHRLPPGDALWLAADNLNALFWGLHDWAHFHHHGSFEHRAWTELQCDASALAWLWVNRREVPLRESEWERVRGEVVALSRRRFDAEREAVMARGATSATTHRSSDDPANEPCGGAASEAVDFDADVALRLEPASILAMVDPPRPR